MEFNQYFEDSQVAYDEAVSKIVELREQATFIKNSMDEIIDACETIENEI